MKTDINFLKFLCDEFRTYIITNVKNCVYTNKRQHLEESMKVFLDLEYINLRHEFYGNNDSTKSFRCQGCDRDIASGKGIYVGFGYAIDVSVKVCRDCAHHMLENEIENVQTLIEKTKEWK